MPRRKDIWRCGIARCPIDAILETGRIDAPISWIGTDEAFTFIADPFGWKDGQGQLHIFVERYDYRTRHGTIEAFLFDEAMGAVDRRTCLAEPWHLSYPQVFAAEGAVWMLPEAHRSGTLTLYRDYQALRDWRPECRIDLDCVPVDASIFRHEGRWWLFYSPATSKATRQSYLHVAWADNLCGPWTPHPGNPVRIDRRSSRPGGMPTEIGGRIMLPVQDCAQTYGGAIRPLWIDRLDEAHFSAVAGDPIVPPASAGRYSEGMHTLNGCGDVTLLDVKRIDTSLSGFALDIRRLLGGYR